MWERTRGRVRGRIGRAVRAVRSADAQAGMSTAEYAVGTTFI